MKPVSEFNKDRRNKDGLHRWCKECMKATQKKRYDANPEKAKALHKKWRDANPERIKAAREKHRNANPKRFWARATLHSHRRKNYKIQITVDELAEMAKQAEDCPFCGCKLAWGSKGKNGRAQPNSPSLDRIDNGQIITADTIQIICNECNTTKRARTMEEFIDYCEMIFKKFKTK